MRIKMLFLLLACLLLAGPIMANPTVKLIGQGVGSTGGGEFIWQVVTGTVLCYEAGDDFIGFSVEADELLQFGKTYDATIDTGAYAGGGPSPTTNPDPLDGRSAALFRLYMIGGLGARTTPLANDVQNSIWYWENEGGSDEFWTPAEEAYNKIVGDALIDAGKVMVMNLTDMDTGGLAKSQIITVPAPGAIMLACIGTSLVGFFRRRKSL